MNPMYYILIGVIVLVVAIDFYFKNKNKKSDSTDIDFPRNISKPNNFLIISICSLLVVLIIGFFVADKFYYDDRLTNNDDNITLFQNLTFQKLSINEVSKLDSNRINNVIVYDEFGNYNGLFINGKKDGLWINFYSNGIKQIEVSYKNDLEEGLLTKYFINGNIEYTEFYVNGELDGLKVILDVSGRKKSEILYDKGYIKSLNSFNPNGTLNYIQYYYSYSKQDFKIKFIERYENGNLINIENFN